LRALRDRLEQELAECAQANVDHAQRVDHVSSLFVPGWQGAELVAALDIEGICVSSGSACSAGTAEASPVIGAMFGRERASSTLRVSLGAGTTDGDIDFAIESLRRVLRRANAIALPSPATPV
jgi:cysteine desulfurase